MSLIYLANFVAYISLIFVAFVNRPVDYREAGYQSHDTGSQQIYGVQVVSLF